MRERKPNLRIAANDVNLIVHSYLIEAGLEQTSSALRNEAKLDLHPNVSAKVPRNELVTLLTKALAYIEAQAHWQKDPDAQLCVAPFELLRPHICIPTPMQLPAPLPTAVIPLDPIDTVEPATDTIPIPSRALPEDIPGEDVTAKRKERSESPLTQREKRARTEEPGATESMDLDVGIVPDELMEVNKVEPQLTIALSQDVLVAQEVKNADSVERAASAIPEERRVGKKAKRSARSPSPTAAFAVPAAKVVTEDKISVSEDDVLYFEGHTAPVYSLAWHPTNSDLLATGSRDSTVRIWALPPSNISGDRPLVLKHEPTASKIEVSSLAWNPDGTLLATGGNDGLCRIFTSSGDVHMILNYHKNELLCMKWSNSGQQLLTGGMDGYVCCWKLDSKEPSHVFRPHYGTGSVLDLVFTGKDSFATCSSDKSIVEITIGNTSITRKFKGHTDEVNKVDVSPSRNALASCSDDHTARVWDLTTPLKDFEGEQDMFGAAVGCRYVLRGHDDSVQTISWRTQDFIVTGSDDRTIRLWDAPSGASLRVLNRHTDHIYSCDFSPDGELVATASGDGRLCVWVTRTGELKKEWMNSHRKVAQGGAIYELRWHTDGTRIAVALENRKAACITVVP